MDRDGPGHPRPRPGECLGDQILGQVTAPGPGDYRPQAALVAGPVELGEARLVLVHVSLTPQPPRTFTGPRRTEPPHRTGHSVGMGALGSWPVGPDAGRRR